jgi:Dihydrofolate reductase
MKRIVLYIASSIDGYIAEADGSNDYLSHFPGSAEMNSDYKTFLGSVDTVIMGGRTYREMQNMDVIWPYKEQTSYIISHYDWGEKENVRFITGNVVETIEMLRRQPGKDIWLFGGGEIISMLLEAGLTDEMRVFYIPIMLGKGIRLFGGKPAPSRWLLTNSQKFDNGVLGITYRREQL